MESILAFTCGFGCGYLTIKALRSFGTVAGCLLLLLTPVQAWANVVFRIHNIGPVANETIFFEHNTYGTWQGFGSALPGAYAGTSFSAPPVTFPWRGKLGDGTIVGGGTLTAQAHGTFDADCANQATPTWSKDWYFTNNTWSSQSYKLVMYDDAHNPTSTNGFDLGPGEVIPISVQQTNAWTAAIYGPPSKSTDYMYDTLLSNYTPTQGQTYNPTPQTNTGTPTQTDPFDDFPAFSTSTNTTGAARQDALGVVSAIGQQTATLSGYLAQIAKQTNNSGGGDNSSLTNLLSQIRDNTKATTNLLNPTPDTGVTLNLISNLTDAAKSIYDASGIPGRIAQWTNSAPSTNDFIETVWAEPMVGAYAINSGLIHKTLSINPFTGDSLMNRLRGIAPWVKKWFGAIITMVVFWLIYHDYTDAVRWAQVGGSNIRIGNQMNLGAKLVMGVAITAATMAAICTIPLAAIAYMDGTGWNMPWLPNLGEDIAAGGPDGGGVFTIMVKFFYMVLADWIPWTTVFAALAIYGTWLFIAPELEVFAHILLRAIGIAAGCGVLLLTPVQTQATTVNIENLTGATLSITNTEGEILTLPPGLMQTELTPSTWTGLSNQFELPSTESFFVRFSGNTDTNAPPVQVYAAEIWGPQQSFIYGLYAGWAIFGFAWSVSALRQGITVYRGT